MTTPQEFTTKILNCTESFQGFKNIYPSVLADLFQGNKSNFKLFIDIINRIAEEREETPINKFYALYLLLKACEACKTDELIQTIVKKDYLISHIFNTAHFSQKDKVEAYESGYNYFSPNPTQQDAIIGINYVRLALEIIIFWSKRYGKNNIEYLFNSFERRAPVNVPVSFWFIGKTYQTNKELAMVDFYHENIPFIPDQQGFEKSGGSEVRKKPFEEKMTQYGVFNEQPKSSYQPGPNPQVYSNQVPQNVNVGQQGYRMEPPVRDVRDVREEVNPEQLRHLSLENDGLKKENSLLKQKLKELQEELMKVSEQDEALIRENNSLQIRLSDFQQKNEGLQNTLNQLLDENYQLRELNMAHQKAQLNPKPVVQNVVYPKETPKSNFVSPNPEYGKQEPQIRQQPQLQAQPMQSIPQKVEQKPRLEDYNYQTSNFGQNKAYTQVPVETQIKDNFQNSFVDNQRRIFRRVNYERPTMVLTPKDLI